ncbi:MAG: DUF4150 domain-containing protein [Gammaproteobacteria bacterium]|nr:DUF4150 domain-containing protein [Gammaproteobacteria bacterium]
MSKHNVFTNSRSNIHKGSGDKAVASAPDVCKTPVGSAVVPVPYPNISQSSTLKKGSKTVKINGQPTALKGSTFASSDGDQAGSLGGIASGVTGKETEFISYSFDVKIEGRNVVRHADMTTHNKKNTMGMVLGSSTTPAVIKKNKKYECDWKNCKGQHDDEIEYENDGCTVRSEYTGFWKEPWLSGTSKKSGKITLAHYKSENKTKHQKAAKELFGKKQYATENHHLIPIATMKKYKKLTHNAKLMGFDINDGKYGICLPYFITDIFKHDLQSHKTSHPSYSKKVGGQLRLIEKESLKYCANNNQHQLINALERYVKKLKVRIESWDKAWLLRKSAINDRVKSYNQAGVPHP